MSEILFSLLSTLATPQSLPLSQHTDAQLSPNDDLSELGRKTQGIAYSINSLNSNGTQGVTMSDIEQDKRLGGQSSGGEPAGSENDLSNVPTSSLVNPKDQALEDGSPSLQHADNDVGDGPLQGLHNLTETSPPTVSTSSQQERLSPASTQQVSSQIIPNTEEPQALPNQDTETDDMGGQPLLPEDDGMGALRRRIHAIRDVGYTNAEQAHMIHSLMTENYRASRAVSDSHLLPFSSPSLSSRTVERPDTPTSPWSGHSFDQFLAPSTSTTTALEPDIYYNLTADDLNPTFYPKAEPDPAALDDVEDPDAEESEEPFLGCQHYKRNVKLQCYTCKKWYTCRFCHDDVEDHHLDRPKTENMLCMLCGHAQPAAQFCKQCGEQSAQYYCGVCKLWDNDSSKSIYHCNDCGICRIGKGIGKDFFHCKTCSVCLPISIENTHRCIERSTQCDCPICGDYMFTSPETVVFMRCGHSIHQRCLSEYSKASYRCPICSKTITNMETTFRNLDRTIQSQPMPVEFKDTRALVYCNDCGAKSVVKYHWLGLRCDVCESYNTAQLRLLQGDILDASEQNGESESVLPARVRSSSHGADEAELSLVSLQIDPSSAPGSEPHPRLLSPFSTDPSGQIPSYNLTRGRAVSPVISNYFGIPPDRESERSKSTSIFGSRAYRAGGNDADGELHFWGTKIKYNYGFLSRVTDPEDEAPAPDDEEGEGEGAGEEEISGSSDSGEDGEEGEEEDDDDEESIDIFGHR